MAGYPDLLRSAIAASESSRRRLSFQLAAETGNQQSSEYRALGKYLSGDEVPSKERGAILAVLLGQHRLALVSEPQNHRRVRLEDIAEAVAEMLENQREVLDLLKDGLPARDAQPRRAAPRRTTNS